MNATHANLIVDVTRALSRAWASPRARRLMLVDYDPALTDAQTILRACMRHRADARLVGM